MSDESESDDDIEGMTIIFDNGSNTTKIGIAGDEKPQFIPSVVGKFQYFIRSPCGGGDKYVGQEALEKMNQYGLNTTFQSGYGDTKYMIYKPIKYGKIIDMNEMERMWQLCFYNKLRVEPDEHGVFILDKPNQSNTREKICTIMFETFNIRNLYIVSQSQTALYSTGKITGLVVDCGYQTTYSTPIYEGYIGKNNEHIYSCNIGGKDVSNYLKQILTESNNINKIIFNESVINDIKHKLCFTNFKENVLIPEHIILGYLRQKTKFNLDKNNISLDIINIVDKYYDGEIYELPDKNKIFLNRFHRTQCVEYMFNPALINNITPIPKTNEIEPSVQEICWKTIESLNNVKMQKDGDFCKDIVLFGGNSMFETFSERFQRELNKLLEYNNDKLAGKINVIVAPKRPYSSWFGASILHDSKLNSFEDMCVLKDEYDETGPSIVWRKFD
eukprot:14113_1